LPAEHALHVRTINSIASTFTTLRHRTSRPNNSVAGATVPGLALETSEETAETLQRIRALEKVAALLGEPSTKTGFRCLTTHGYPRAAI
jgi:hypothetical protein